MRFQRAIVANDKMMTSRNGSTTSLQEAHEERVLSDFEKIQVDEEKAIGMNGMGDNATLGKELGLSSVDDRSLKIVKSHQSRAGGDGYTCLDTESVINQPNTFPSRAATGEPYLVTWDGDADPLNPRSMPKLRRWAIVFICGLSSVCVYVVADQSPRS